MADKQLFSNETILKWLKYFAENTPMDLDQIKMMDITKRNKNIIPTVESNKAVLAFMEAGDQEVFYRMWNAGLGDCEVWYNEGAEPEGEVKHDKLKDMINRGINESAGMLVVNEKFRNTKRAGIDNIDTGSEIRAIVRSKMGISYDETVCVIGGKSLAIEAAFEANEGTVIAIEYDKKERAKLAELIEFYDLRNVIVRDHVDRETFDGIPAPATVFLVASASMEQELEFLVKRNPKINVVIYTLDLTCAGNIEENIRKLGLKNPEIIQVQVQKLVKNSFEAEPAPWIITCKSEE